MLELIKLELRKNKLSVYLLVCLWILIMGFGFCFLLAFIPQIGAVETSLPAPVDIMIFTQWNTFMMMISILIAMSFTILSAVMHTKFTVEEYTVKEHFYYFHTHRVKIKFYLQNVALCSYSQQLVLCYAIQLQFCFLR